jgi:hypothetical protein
MLIFVKKIINLHSENPRKKKQNSGEEADLFIVTVAVHAIISGPKETQKHRGRQKRKIF